MNIMLDITKKKIKVLFPTTKKEKKSKPNVNIADKIAKQRIVMYNGSLIILVFFIHFKINNH